MTDRPKQNPAELSGALAKVPTVTLGFWIIKVLATTLGETAPDQAVGIVRSFMSHKTLIAVIGGADTRYPQGRAVAGRPVTR